MPWYSIVQSSYTTGTKVITVAISHQLLNAHFQYNANTNLQWCTPFKRLFVEAYSIHRGKITHVLVALKQKRSQQSLTCRFANMFDVYLPKYKQLKKSVLKLWSRHLCSTVYTFQPGLYV